MTDSERSTPPSTSPTPQETADPNPVAIRMLVLGNSFYQPRKGTDASALPQNRTEPERDALLGGRLERIIKTAWPNPRLPDMTEQWIRESDPDCVLFIINEFWFNYRSLPALVNRRFGPVGPQIAKLGGWAGRNPTLAYSRIFQKVRRIASDTAGADAHFEPDEVIAVSKDVLRRIARAEGVVPLVMGPFTVPGSTMLSPKFQAEGAQRRMQVHLALKEFCAANHIEYASLDDPRISDLGKGATLLPDGVHLDTEGVTTTMAQWNPVLTDFLVRAQKQRRGDQHDAKPLV